MESRESLEDLVYRSTLSEGNRAGRGASPWVSVPITFTVCGIFGVSAMLLARQTRTARTIIHSVGVILQEAPDAPAPVRAVPAAPPAPRSQAPAPVPAAAPPPERQPKGPPPQPPDPRQEAAPDAAPRSLPTLDNSRLHGGSAGSGTTAGAAPGTIAGAGGGGNGVMDLDLTQVREKFRPPPPAYPPLARNARIQGNVVIQIVVGLDGVPMSTRALEGPFQLRSAAEAYAMTWRFEPYLQNGIPLVSRFNLTVAYRIKP